MSTTSKKETQTRLAGIRRGPWSRAYRRAKRALAPAAAISAPNDHTSALQLEDLTHDQQVIQLERLDLTGANRQRAEQLKWILRPHWLDEEGVTDLKEIRIRESLDQVLTLAQLYELAVETEYLPVEAIRAPARKLLSTFLWSPAARAFVEDYDYLSVPMLASRVGVTGFGETLPPTQPYAASLRFASFLAHILEFYDNDHIETWVDFLDDYVHEDDEPMRFRLYLRDARNRPPERAATLLLGCRSFVTSLASAFNVLDQEELGRFGLFHAYWLQKFFGYEMDNTGYFKNSYAWDPDDSWARTIADSGATFGSLEDDDLIENAQQFFRSEIDVLARAFECVRELASRAMRHSPGSDT